MLFVSVFVSLFGGFILGRKYQDFADIMLARRVAKLLDVGKRIEAERQAYNRVTGQESKNDPL